jgi:hypothetical protein
MRALTNSLSKGMTVIQNLLEQDEVDLPAHAEEEFETWLDESRNQLECMRTTLNEGEE